jgi:hypothetical protein
MPDLPNRPRYAARLNAFKVGLPGRPTLADMVGRAATVAGLDAADLNYPDHFADHAPDAPAAPPSTRRSGGSMRSWPWAGG